MTRLLDTRHPRALLTLLCLLLWTPGFFTIPPGDRDESRFAQATHQMLETHDFVRIMNGTEPRNRKPIGIYWLQAPFAAAAQHLGLATLNPIWPYRIPSALGGLLAVLATFELGHLLLGRRTALLAAAMLAACTLLVVEVHIAKTDAALLGATTLSMALLARAYTTPGPLTRPQAAAFWLALAAGILLKGPITPLVAGLTTLTLLLLDRRRRPNPWLRALHPAWGLPLMLAAILPWFVAIGLATHGQFFTDAVGGDLARKLSSGDDAHGGPPGLHLLLLPLLLFPITAALPPAAATAWRTRHEPATRFLLAWIIPTWLVLEATPTKLPHYALPLYPAICLLAALAVTTGAPRFRRLGTALAAICLTLFVLAPIAAPLVLGTPNDPAPFWPGLLAGAAAFLLGWWALRAWRPAAALATIALAILLNADLLGTELPRLTPLWLAPRIVAARNQAEAQGLLPPHPRLGSVGFSEPSLMFLAGTGTQWLLPGEAIQALTDHAIDTLLVGDRDLPTLQAALAASNLPLRTLATIEGINYSRGRHVTLTLLAPIPPP